MLIVSELFLLVSVLVMTLILSLWYRFVTSFGIVDVIDIVNLSAIVAVTVRQAWSQLVLMRKDVSYGYNRR